MRTQEEGIMSFEEYLAWTHTFVPPFKQSKGKTIPLCGLLFSLLDTLNVARQQGLDITKLGVSRELLTALVETAVERDKTGTRLWELKMQLDKAIELLKMARSPAQTARPDADSDL